MYQEIYSLYSLVCKEINVVNVVIILFVLYEKDFCGWVIIIKDYSTE